MSARAISLEEAIDSNLDDFIKDYYEDRYSVYIPKRKFFKEPRFLVVEDDLTYKPLWDFILRKVDKDFSYDWVTSVDDADKLLEQAFEENRPYDLIICDIFLEGDKTGLDLWKNHGLIYNNMLLVSNIDYEQLIKDLRHEVYIPPYLKKPLNVEESVKAINKSLLMSYF